MVLKISLKQQRIQTKVHSKVMEGDCFDCFGEFQKQQPNVFVIFPVCKQEFLILI